MGADTVSFLKSITRPALDAEYIRKLAERIRLKKLVRAAYKNKGNNRDGQEQGKNDQ